MTESWVRITGELSIPLSEIAYRASRSSGPGGQHANTSSTRVELVWDARASTSLSPEQRERILEKLSSRLTAEGVLILASEATRSQYRNREDATRRFVDLLRTALHLEKPRKPTRPTRASRERRLEAKKHRSAKKKLRGSVPHD